MVSRKALAALIAPALLTGCAAGSGGRLAIRNDPTLQAPKVAVDQILAQNNRNAELVERMYSEISVSGNLSRFSGGLGGKLALERPRNFHLDLGKPFTRTAVAELGSNDQEFWFWAKDSKEREIVVGEFGAGGALPQDMPLPFQPDWIVEALGLHAIPADERVQVQKSSDPSTIVLVHHRDDGHGSTTIKKTYYDATTKRVKRHEFFSGGQTQPLAVVTPSQYGRVRIAATRDDATTADVDLPHKIHIRLAGSRDPKDTVNIDLELTAGTVKVNPDFNETFREANFTLPKHEGYAYRRLSAPPAYAAESSARAYESRPVPPAGAGTSLGDPVPFGAEGTSFRWDDPVPLDSDLPSLDDEPAGVETIVRPGIPAASDGSSYSSAPPRERRTALGTGFDR